MFNEVCIEDCKWLDEKLELRHEELRIENNRVGCSLLLGAVFRSVTELQRHWALNSSSLFPASGMICILGWSASQCWSRMFVRLSEMFRWIVLFESAYHRFGFPAMEIGTLLLTSGSRVRQGESLNILSINPKDPYNATVCLQEKWSSQNKIFKTISCTRWDEWDGLEWFGLVCVYEITERRRGKS